MRVGDPHERVGLSHTISGFVQYHLRSRLSLSSLPTHPPRVPATPLHLPYWHWWSAVQGALSTTEPESMSVASRTVAAALATAEPLRRVPPHDAVVEGLEVGQQVGQLRNRG
jgi:hypothetical protein